MSKYLTWILSISVELCNQILNHILGVCVFLKFDRYTHLGRQYIKEIYKKKYKLIVKKYNVNINKEISPFVKYYLKENVLFYSITWSLNGNFKEK